MTQFMPMDIGFYGIYWISLDGVGRGFGGQRGIRTPDILGVNEAL